MPTITQTCASLLSSEPFVCQQDGIGTLGKSLSLSFFFFLWFSRAAKEISMLFTTPSGGKEYIILSSSLLLGFLLCDPWFPTLLPTAMHSTRVCSTSIVQSVVCNLRSRWRWSRQCSGKGRGGGSSFGTCKQPLQLWKLRMLPEHRDLPEPTFGHHGSVA